MSILYPCSRNFTTFIFIVYEMYLKTYIDFWYLVQKLNSLQLLGHSPQTPCFRYPLLNQALFPYNYIHSLTSTSIIVTKLARPNTGALLIKLKLMWSHISKLCMHPKIHLMAALLTGLEHIAPYIKFLLTDILISLSCLATYVHS